MENYSLDEKYSFACVSASKGVQKKYFKDGWFYKLNVEGNEGLKEWLVSCVLECSSLPTDSYVKYEACRINGKPGCRSYNFLKAGESFVPMGKVFTAVTGENCLADHLAILEDANKRLEFLLDLAEPLVGRENFREYLYRTVQLDMLIENTDRHEFNYGLIMTKNAYKIAPIFDND